MIGDGLLKTADLLLVLIEDKDALEVERRMSQFQHVSFADSDILHGRLVLKIARRAHQVVDAFTGELIIRLLLQ